MTASLRDLLYAKERLEEVAGMLDQLPPGTTAPKETRVLGAVVEIGLQPDTITPAAFNSADPNAIDTVMLLPNTAMVAGYANGDARLLFSKGGGLLGDLYNFPAIAQAAKSLVATAQSIYTSLPMETQLPPLPADGMLRFAMLTIDERRATQIPEKEITQPNHPLHILFSAMNELLTQLRVLQEGIDKQQKPDS